MRIAIFSDIHANIYAFRSALDDAAECGVTDYIILGDLITDLPWVNGVYDLIRGLHNVKIIRGNRERMLLTLGASGEAKQYHQMASIYQTYTNLSEENKEYISTLPDELSFELNGTYFHLNHCPSDIWGNQVSDGLHYFANSTDTHEDYTNIMTNALKNHPDVIKLRQGITMYGHFHGQWHCKLGDTMIINPGSCGLAGDNDPRAEYSILSYQDGHWSVDERRVEYSRENTLEEFRSSAFYKASPIWSEAVAMMIETGRENVHLLFDHLNNACKARGMSQPYYPYPNDLWDSEGQRWLFDYKRQCGSGTAD
jgi:predicted phosphodiesterase